MNKYAFSLLAIYGMSYISAAKQTFSLLRSKGLEALINDDLSGMVLNLACLATGALCAGVGMLWAAGFGWDAWWAMGLIGFVVGFAICNVVMTCLDSAVATVYVGWVG